MSFKVWQAIRTEKGIESYKDMINQYRANINKLRKWIRRDTERLKKQVKGLSSLENLEFGFKTGHINHADYIVMKAKMEEKY